ncbi:hypothetical protein DY000_02004833 [Brassica cretica]|uniref:Uncharacterized protein n=1 Tax=Brassica cretica TaxID=69181 RepID=A0ABQ7BTN1_BRACR|nr:hypothetical protein DY000_02004833 [Brassica cretica]
MAVWCKARAFSTAMYGLGQAMKMSGAIKREDRAMYKDRASGTDRSLDSSDPSNSNEAI